MVKKLQLSLRRRAGGETGSASLELAILMPAILLMMFTGIQIAAWYYARSIALTAAQVGVDAGRVQGSDVDQGVAESRNFLSKHAKGALLSTSVSSAGSSATEIRIRVRGVSPAILPGIPKLTIDQEARAPVERITG